MLIVLLYRHCVDNPSLENEKSKSKTTDTNKYGNGTILELQRKERKFPDSEKHSMVCVSN